MGKGSGVDPKGGGTRNPAQKEGQKAALTGGIAILWRPCRIGRQDQKMVIMMMVGGLRARLGGNEHLFWV